MGELPETGKPWTQQEVQETVSVYLRMLRMQELRQDFVKANLNRQLSQKIPARSVSAIDYKFRNISAVLHELGVQSVNGYKPLPNVQGLLIDVVSDMLEGDDVLDSAAIRSVETPVEFNSLENFDRFLVAPPTLKARTPERPVTGALRKPIRRDYLEREARNRSLGHAGELLIMEFEAHRLRTEGAKQYVDQIEHVSSSKGDGLGYDIRSFESDGRERFIEVKTTAYDAETPFFVSSNELSFSSEMADQFHLYRLFSFRKKPRMFTMPGAVAKNFSLDPVSYRATLLGAQTSQ